MVGRNDYNPVPEVQARTAAPDDFQHIEANPNAFGAEEGQAIQRFGQAALQTAHFYGQVAADNASNNTLQQVTNILHGDPSKTVMGADGQPTADTGYLGMLGANAMKAREGTMKAIDDAIEKGRSSLSTPESQLQYDVDTRRWRAQWASEVGSHADQQQKTWAVDTNTTSLNLALNDAARNPLDPTKVQDVTDRARKALVRNASILGTDPSGAILKADQEVGLARLRSVIASDPGNAQKVLDETKGVLGSLPNYDGIVRSVKEATINHTLGPAIDQAVGEATKGALGQTGIATGTPDLPTLSAAFFGQESGNRDNVGTSVNGAVGPGQIEPNTFAAYAKPGERIDNPADNRAVQQRILADYSQRYNGDVGRVAVAYFSGPGNVAPAGSPTPWLHDRVDGNGKSTSSYVSDIESRLSKYPSTADAITANMPNVLAKAQKTAENLFPDYPDAQERYVLGVQRRLEQSVSQQRQLYEVDTHIVQSTFTGPHPPISEDQLEALGPQYKTAWESMQVTNPLAAEGVRRMFDANARGAAGTLGTETKGYLDRVLAPSADPNRITNPAGLWPYVGKGDDAVLTNTGAGQLAQLLSLRSGPQGETFAAQAKTFFDNVHADLTFSSAAAGRNDPKGEALFSKFVATAIPIMVNAQKSGSLDKVLNPNSPDYLGNLAITLARKPAQIMRDRLENTGMAAEETKYMDEGARGRYLLKQAVQSGRLTVQQAKQVGLDLGYFRPSATPKPGAPATPAPEPSPMERAMHPTPPTLQGGG